MTQYTRLQRATEALDKLMSSGKATLSQLAQAVLDVADAEPGMQVAYVSDEYIGKLAERARLATKLEDELAEARATIARLESLPEKWRADYRKGYEPRNAGNALPDVHTCIVELRRALKGTL